jgi:hypothetical protein
MDAVFENNFQSFRAFYDGIKDARLRITRKQAKEFYDRQQTTQVFKRPRDKGPFIPIRCPYGVGCLQADLLDVARLSSHNYGVKFLLNIVDVKSRFAWSFPLNNKKPESVLPHLKKAFADVQRLHPNHSMTFTTDEGSEFKGVVSKFLATKGIKHYSSTNKTNTSLVERFHQNIWNYIKKKIEISKSFQFLEAIKAYLKFYNNDIHSNLDGSSPNDVFKNNILIGDVPIAKSSLKIGDLVRIAKDRNLFDKKSFELQFSRAVYQIVGQKGFRFQLKNVDSGNILQTMHLERSLMKVKSPLNVDNTLDVKTKKLNKTNQVNRRNKRETAFQLDEGERRRLQPQGRRKITKPIRFRGDGINFF